MSGAISGGSIAPSRDSRPARMRPSYLVRGLGREQKRHALVERRARALEVELDAGALQSLQQNGFLRRRMLRIRQYNRETTRRALRQAHRYPVAHLEARDAAQRAVEVGRILRAIPTAAFMHNGERVLRPVRELEPFHDDLALARVDAARFQTGFQGGDLAGERVERPLCFLGRRPAELVSVVGKLLPQCRALAAKMPDRCRWSQKHEQSRGAEGHGSVPGEAQFPEQVAKYPVEHGGEPAPYKF